MCLILLGFSVLILFLGLMHLIHLINNGIILSNLEDIFSVDYDCKTTRDIWHNILWAPFHDAVEISWVLFRGIALVDSKVYFPGLIMEIWNVYWRCNNILLVSTFLWLLIYKWPPLQIIKIFKFGWLLHLLHNLFISLGPYNFCIYNYIWLNFEYFPWFHLFGQIFKDLSTVKKALEASHLFKQDQSGGSMTSLPEEWSPCMLKEINQCYLFNLFSDHVNKYTKHLLYK